MICPHCSLENSEGRKYCRGCAKPLVPEPVRERSAPFEILNVPPSEPLLSKKALASFILSFFSLFVPIGISAIVLGHMSRHEIVKSGGRLRGGGIAFAGLILGYLQLAIAAVLALAGVGLWHQFNQELDKNPYSRAVLVDRIKNGDRYKITAEATIQHQKKAVEALSIIRSRQSEYLSAHPEEGYACGLEQLSPPFVESELRTLITNSQYQITVLQCRGNNELRYVVLAVPHSNSNLPDSPAYCLDSTDVMYEYSTELARDAIARVAGKDRELCPQDGKRVTE